MPGAVDSPIRFAARVGGSRQPTQPGYLDGVDGAPKLGKWIRQCL